MLTKSYSFEIENSLMDRYIHVHLDNLTRWISHGMPTNTEDKIYKDRQSWFETLDYFNNVRWNVNYTTQYKLKDDIKEEIKEAIYLVFAILGKKGTSRILNSEDEKYAEVHTIFNDMVRIAVNEKMEFTTPSQYSKGIISTDLALQYFIYKLGFFKVVKTTYTDKKGVERHTTVTILKGEEKNENLRYEDIENFITRCIKKVLNKNYFSLVYYLRKHRNDETHNAFYIEPERYCERLTYILYDYITIAFFLRRYFRKVVTEPEKVTAEHWQAVKEASEEAEKLIAEVNKINVRFRYLKNQDVEQRLTILSLETQRTSYADNGNVPVFITEDGGEFCCYDMTLDRKSNYSVQSLALKNGIETDCGKPIVVEGSKLYDGAVVTLKIPTDEMDYPEIASAVTRSICLTENSENRAVLSNLLNQCISDSTFRDKLRVLLMLDPGDRENIINGFLGNGKPTAVSVDPEEFKKYIAEKCDEFSDHIRQEFDKLQQHTKRNDKKAEKRYENLLHEIQDGNLTLSKMISILEDYKGSAFKQNITIFLGCIVTLFLLGCSGGLWFLSGSSSSLIYKTDWLSEYALKLGNSDVAFNRATYLDSLKNYPEAAKWYMAARKSYAELLAENPDSLRALRMTRMLMRGKGGVVDTHEAESYAKMANRYDILSLLITINGDRYKARDLVNNYQGPPSAFIELADALTYLLYPHSVNNEDKILRCWTTIDSLASTTNIANEEALVLAADVCRFGVTDKDGTYIIYPSLYDAAAYLTDGDVMHNSSQAQTVLASIYSIMGLKKDAERYKHKAHANGRKDVDEIPFSTALANELEHDPQALAARAHNNAEKGYTDYRMTAHLYHLADSINAVSHQYVLGAEFYTDWLKFIVDAEDVNSVEKILPLIRKDYPDSVRSAIADYVMAMKVANLKIQGIPADSAAIISEELTYRAARKGLDDAIVSVAASWILQNEPDGVKILEKMAYGKDGRCHIPAARYVISEQLKKNMLDTRLLRNLGDSDEYALTIKLSDLSITDLLRFSKETISSLKGQINIVLSQKSDLTQSAYLFGRLAEMEYLLGDNDAAKFYINAASRLSPEDSYISFWNISEFARRKGEEGSAASFTGRFAKVFFGMNGKVIDETHRSQVVEHLYHLYPDLLELVKKETGHDFLKDTFFFVDGKFDLIRDFKSYLSPVKKLNVKLPEIKVPMFPITAKYFD